MGFYIESKWKYTMLIGRVEKELFRLTRNSFVGQHTVTFNPFEIFLKKEYKHGDPYKKL